jgi:hypothetical protein
MTNGHASARPIVDRHLTMATTPNNKANGPRAQSLPAPAVVAADKVIGLRRQRQAQPEQGLAGSAAPASSGEFSGSTAA